MSHLLVHLELLSMPDTFFNLNTFSKFRFLQKSAKIVVVLAYVLNAMVKDLCSRNCQRKVLRRQDWLQRIWPLDIQQGILSSTLSLSLSLSKVWISPLNWTELDHVRLPKKWSYCTRCSSARNCSTCGGRGKLSY